MSAWQTHYAHTLAVIACTCVADWRSAKQYTSIQKAASIHKAALQQCSLHVCTLLLTIQANMTKSPQQVCILHCDFHVAHCMRPVSGDVDLPLPTTTSTSLQTSLTELLADTSHFSAPVSIPSLHPPYLPPRWLYKCPALCRLLLTHAKFSCCCSRVRA